MIKIPFAAGQTFLVLGYGKSGIAAAAALKDSGAEVLVWDDQDAARQKAQADGYTVASHTIFEKKTIHGVIASPGIPLEHPAPHPVIRSARKTETPVMSDLDLLFRAMPDANYIGVTGTNGKSTTTALITHILKSAGHSVQMGGNIGIPALSLEPTQKDGYYVLELSSYQLDLIQSNPLAVGVILNITPDHIDHHGSMENYIAAKEKMAAGKRAQTIVIGTDEPESQALYGRLKARDNLTVYEVSVTHQVLQGVHYTNKKLTATFDPQPLDLTDIKTLPGAHNGQNAAAAMAVCHALGLPRAEIESGMRSFKGLEHRQQLVACIQGVSFVNDSKATNADAASKALVCYENIYWIIGGRPKAGGLNGLERLVGTVRHAFIIGEASEAFADWCRNKIPFTLCGTLDVAVEKAARTAWNDGQKNACVLLSPACASFDQYARFEDRGTHFADLVYALTPPKTP